MFTYYAVRIFCTMFTCAPVLIQPPEVIVPEMYSPAELDYLRNPQQDVANELLDVAIIRSKGHYDHQENGMTSYVEKENNPVVWIKDGGLKGFKMETLTGKKFSAFQNIPFAKPPVGPLRFRAPVKNHGWKGVRHSISPSPTCLQADYIQLFNVTGTEDCLYLNVYAPKIPKHHEHLQLPVMVFIHGGGYFFGSSSIYGPTYMMEENIVLVSMNYRLGPLGFLSTGDDASPGNNGLKDQVLALKWIQENIEVFGGDPKQVTIFGESAGAASVQFHMVSQLSKGLFHGGISQSGCTFCFWSISENAKQISRDFAKLYNCDSEDSNKLVECLRQIDGTALVQGQLSFLEWTTYPSTIFAPVIEPKNMPGSFLDDFPANIYAKGQASQVPWVTGFNSAETALNIAAILTQPQNLMEVNEEWDRIGPIWLNLKSATEDPAQTAKIIRDFYMSDRNLTFDTRHEANRMMTDRYLVYCGVQGIEHHAKLNKMPVYAYYLDYAGTYSTVNLLGQNAADWGVAHLDDLIYLLNNTAYYQSLKATDDDFKFSRLLVNVWANFARTGKPFLTEPNGRNNYFWESVTLDSKSSSSGIPYAALNLNPKMIADPFKERVEFWKRLDLKDYIPHHDLSQIQSS